MYLETIKFDLFLLAALGISLSMFYLKLDCLHSNKQATKQSLADNYIEFHLFISSWTHDLSGTMNNHPFFNKSFKFTSGTRFMGFMFFRSEKQKREEKHFSSLPPNYSFNPTFSIKVSVIISSWWEFFFLYLKLNTKFTVFFFLILF